MASLRVTLITVVTLLSPGVLGTLEWGESIRGDVDWWKKTIVYQIYPRSFQDSDGDGVGDIQGIISRLDYFSYLEVGAIWLSPVYKSPMIDHGYDIQDFVDIDPIFGTLKDFDQLVKEAHDRGIYIIMDYIPNHTSDQHAWFVESRKGGANNPYSDFYMWADGKLLENGTRVPPNQWVSCFAVPMWTWDEGRQQYYLHQFAVQQPDLNYRNPTVVKEMLKVFQFWLDRGVDGFRIDAVGTIFESKDLSLEEPRSFLPGVQPHEQFYFDHIYTRDQPEIHDVVRGWRKLFDEHDRTHGGHTFMVAEIYTNVNETMKYYESGADMPFNFNLLSENLNDCGGTCFHKIINGWLEAMPRDKWPNYVLGNHDKLRVSGRKGSEYVDGLNVMLLTLPGTPTTYYGEEIGLNNIAVAFEDSQDPWAINLGPDLYMDATRDPCRSPMQWSDAPHAGFSDPTAKPWLPVHPDYKLRNVKAQKAIQGSSLRIYRQTANIRQRREFQTNQLTFHVINNNVISYIRHVPGCQSSAAYLIAVNVGGAESTDSYVAELEGRSYKTGVVVLDTEAWDRSDTVLCLKEVTLKVGQALVIRLTERTTKDEL
jgi:alpha-glucosidase